MDRFQQFPVSGERIGQRLMTLPNLIEDRQDFLEVGNISASRVTTGKLVCGGEERIPRCVRSEVAQMRFNPSVLQIGLQALVQRAGKGRLSALFPDGAWSAAQAIVCLGKVACRLVGLSNHLIVLGRERGIEFAVRKIIQQEAKTSL